MTTLRDTVIEALEAQEDALTDAIDGLTEYYAGRVQSSEMGKARGRAVDEARQALILAAACTALREAKARIEARKQESAEETVCDLVEGADLGYRSSLHVINALLTELEPGPEPAPRDHKADGREFTCPACSTTLEITVDALGPSMHAPVGAAALSRYFCPQCRKDVPYIETMQRPTR